MNLTRINQNSLLDDRVRRVNRLMSDVNNTADNIYENIMDNDSKLSNHYLNKMIGICEEAKQQLKEYINKQ